MEEKKKRINFKRFLLNIVLPSLLSILLFIVLIFWYVIPYFEENLLISKKEMIRELVHSTIGIAEKNYQDARAGKISEDAAKLDAIDKIRHMRYGSEQKDYFFITSMQPLMIMHPYRPDLDQTDLTNFKDPNGKALFVEMVRNIKNKGDGFVDYKWQWMDDSLRIVPKISYVREFKPWGWVIGTGIYIEDVRLKISEIEQELIYVSIAISVIIVLLLIVIVFQNFKTEEKRTEAEKKLLESKDKYQSLVEASTEGTAMILGGELIYSNKLFDELFNISVGDLEKGIQYVFRFLNDEGIENIMNFSQSDISFLRFESAIKLNGNKQESIIIALSKIRLYDKDGLILTIKDLSGESLLVSEKNKWSREIYQLLSNMKSSLFIISLSDNGKFVDFNDNTVNILKYPSHRELQKKSITDLIENSHEAVLMFKTIKEMGFADNYHLRIRDYSGNLMTISVTARYYEDETTGKELLSGIFSDISDLIEKEEMRERNRMDFQVSMNYLNTELKHFIRETVSCNYKLSTKKAVDLMARYNTGLLLIRSDDGAPLGLITDRDIRSRIIIDLLNVESPVSDFMTSPLISLPETALLSDALILMEEKKIQHLFIKDKSGSVIGYLGLDIILGKHNNVSHILVNSVSQAQTLDDLKSIYNRLPFFVESAIEGTGNTSNVLSTLANVTEKITEKISELIFFELGDAPVPFAFVALGSEGRREQTLISDQDNAMIYDDSDPTKAEESAQYFARFAERMNYMLDAVGYPYCTGDVMAKNPKWNQPLSKWKTYFQEWITNPEPQNLLEIAIFFDMKLSVGSQFILDNLQEFIFRKLKENPAFYTFLAREGMSYKTQISFFGRIQTENSDEHSKSVNLKNPLRVIVHLIRLYAMRNDLTETNTLRRFRKLYEKNVITEIFYKEVVFAYEFLTVHQLRSQIHSLKYKTRLVNHIDISTLSSIEYNILKNVFTQISTFQNKIKYDFGLSE
jgi:signal-transduction protein with cAMP-binding, CBS, and nucleotidyltransferase domain/PAS domain-containing protein